MPNSNETYSQLIGPTQPEIETGSTTEYPSDSYDEYYGEKEINISWFWITFFAILLTVLVGGFFYIKKKLKRKDRDEKSLDGVLMEVRVPRNNELEIGVAESMFANLYGIGC